MAEINSFPFCQEYFFYSKSQQQTYLNTKTIQSAGDVFYLHFLHNKVPIYKKQFKIALYINTGPGSSVGIATDLRAGMSGDRILMGVRFSSPVQTGRGAHPASCTMGTGSYPGVKRPGRGVDHPPHLAPRLKKEYSFTSTPPLGLRGLIQGELYLYPFAFIYIYIYIYRPELPM